MRVKDKEFRIFLSEEEIIQKVRELASRISLDYQDKSPLFLAVLNGSFIFAADLFRELKFAASITFTKLSSYELDQSSGKVKELFGLNEEISGRHLVIVEDIVDTGNTLNYLIGRLKAENPASIEVASLLLKKEIYKGDFRLKYVGFEIPSHFVVGYGLDYDGYGRNFKSIYQCIES
jgi:hypoxanthine phosphoribosyltransferase